MWAKISGALKRPETPSAQEHFDLDRGDEDRSHLQPTIMSAVLNQHPNLSNFHDPKDVPFPQDSPPPSPSKFGSKRALFKRWEKADGEEHGSLALKLSIPRLKKVKSSMHTSSSSDASSISRASTDSNLPRESQESIRPLQDFMPTPVTPSADSHYKSILRDGTTPGTGASVRFFSRDIVRDITPDVSNMSETPSEPSPASFAARLKGNSTSTPIRPPLQDVFSPPPPSSLKPLPPPNDTNIFDLSSDFELPPIPISKDAHFLNNAIELTSDDTDATAARIVPEEELRSSTPTRGHDRSQSFSFGQSVFQSLSGGGRDSPKPSPILGPDISKSRRGSLRPKNRNRAYSDTVFHSMLQSPPTQKESSPPEADIDDRSNRAVVVYAGPESPKKEKDPFGAHATAYYTPGTGVPTTPPQAPASHARKASREEDIILHLRTQLALQTELCAQYEIDLRGRDELARMANSRLEEALRECDRRKNVIRSWRKRVAELERCVHTLQDEVDRSREENVERSVMDEASGMALRKLHWRIEELEREKAALEKRGRDASLSSSASSDSSELDAARAELIAAKEELANRDQAERELQAGIARAQEQMQSMEVSLIMEEAERSRNFSTAAWDEERKALRAANEALRAEHLQAETQLADARDEVVQKDGELGVLKAELEAQWKSTEAQTEKITELEKERDTLQDDLDALNARISDMEVEWTQSENRKNELEMEMQEVWAAKEEFEREYTELQQQLDAEQEHAEQLTISLREREDKVSALEQEHKYALDRATRVEARLHEREDELAQLMKRQSEQENDVDAAQSELAQAKREHARIVNEQSRKLQDVVAREVEARAAMEVMVREKAESDVHASSLRERAESLDAELDKLRRQVHELQQESADKEVKLVQLQKQRSQDKEDITGLNIALDSKQQELELLKRRISVRGTAGSTPASTAKVPTQRRESSIFGTPSVASRPPSVLSDTGSVMKERRGSETPSTVSKAPLSRSTVLRTTAPVTKASVTGAMGPPSARNSTSGMSSATPTRIPAGPSARGTPSTIKAPASQRRMSASILEPSKLRSSTSSKETLLKLQRLPSLSSASETDEKENSVPSPASSTSSTSTKITRRMSAMPA